MKKIVQKLNSKSLYIYNNFNPYTNVLGVARSFLGLGLLILFLFNSMDNVFLKSSGNNKIYKNAPLSIFSYLPENYLYFEIVRWIFIIILILIIIGWRPKLLAIPHTYIAYCINSSGVVIDGGEQVAFVFSILLLPILLFDNRKWHWENASITPSNKNVLFFISYTFIRIQVAILYLHSFVGKLFNEEWINGTAVYYYLKDPMLGTPLFLNPIIYPILDSPFVALITWFALLIQLILVCSLFIDKKYWRTVLILALLFHESIAILLGLFSFSAAMIGVLILYLRPLEKTYNLFKKEESLNES